MKTISLKNVKDGLSRDEMRAVKGGCFGSGYCVPRLVPQSGYQAYYNSCTNKCVLSCF